MTRPRSVAVERLASRNDARFLGEIRLRRPAILTGALARWPGTMLSLRALAERFGTQPVFTYRIADDATTARMSALRANFHHWSDADLPSEHLRHGSFGDFLGSLEAGEPGYCMANRTKNTRLRDLLAQASGEVECAIAPEAGVETERREYFIGSDGSGPGLHHDGATESLLCQLAGAKQVNLFAPRDIPYLYPTASWLEPNGHFSLVADSFSFDRQRFPLFAHATAHTARLESGDLLYIPPYWFHDAAATGPGISMSLRVPPPAEAWGTAEERAALAQSAREFRTALLRLAPESRVAYAELVRKDLADAVPGVPGRDPADG